MRYLVYDIEVLQQDWCLVAKDPYAPDSEYIVIKNDREAIVNLINDRLDDTIFIGFNNKGYDDYIVRFLYHKLGDNPVTLNNHIIKDREFGHSYDGMIRAWHPRFMSWDLRNSSINRYNMSIGLKEYEAYKGMEIKECSVPWDYPHRLNPDQWNEVLHYCKYDVDATIALFLEPEQQKELQMRFDLTSKFNLDIRKTIYLTNAKFGAMILGATGQPKKFETGLRDYFKIPDWIHVENPDVRNFYEEKPVGEIENKTISMFGIDFILSAGGLHASKTQFKAEGDFLSIDATQMYPTLLVKQDLISRAVKEQYVERLANSIKERNAIKHTNKALSDALKLFNNTVSGAADAPFNPLYDPYNTISLRLIGQLVLIDLCEKLAPHVEIIYANTDGILVRNYDMKVIKPIIAEWENRVKLKMDYEYFQQVVIKDVNNYIMLDTRTDEVKVKGGLVKFWEGGHVFNWQTPVIAKAIVEKLIFDKSVEDTIAEAYWTNDIRDFQIVTKVSSKFKDSVTYLDEQEVVLDTKINRVYATKDERFGGIFKRKATFDDEGNETLAYHKIAKTPDHCWIVNIDILEHDKHDIYDHIDLDLEYYAQRAKDEIKLFTGE